MEFDFLMFGYKNSYQQPYFKPKNNHSRVSILESEVKGLRETIKKKDVEISKMALNNMNNRNSLETAMENTKSNINSINSNYIVKAANSNFISIRFFN